MKKILMWEQWTTRNRLGGSLHEEIISRFINYSRWVNKEYKGCDLMLKWIYWLFAGRPQLSLIRVEAYRKNQRNCR